MKTLKTLPALAFFFASTLSFTPIFAFAQANIDPSIADCHYPGCTQSFDCNQTEVCSNPSGAHCGGSCVPDTNPNNSTCSYPTCNYDQDCTTGGPGLVCSGAYTSGPCSGTCRNAATGGVPSGSGSGNYGSSGSGGGINQAPIKAYSDSIINIINGILVPLLMAVAFIVFLYGVFNYFIAGASSEDKRAEGRIFVLYGVIGFAVILSVWGLVNLLLTTFNLSPGGGHPSLPTL